jgi:hypothetical protein
MFVLTRIKLLFFNFHKFKIRIDYILVIFSHNKLYKLYLGSEVIV